MVFIGVWLALADILNLILVLVAVDFATWTVLPWAFYNQIKNNKKAVNQLRDAQALFFASGVFFVITFLADLERTNQGIGIVILINSFFLEFLLGSFGFVALALALYESFRVVNVYVGMAKEEEIAQFKLMYFPFNLFSYVLVFFAALLSAVAKPLPPPTYPFLHILYIGSLLITLPLSFLGFRWFEFIFTEERKGYLAFLFILLPYILLAVYIVLFNLGVNFS